MLFHLIHFVIIMCDADKHDSLESLSIMYNGNRFASTSFGSGESIVVDGIGTFAGFREPYGLAIDKSLSYLISTDTSAKDVRQLVIGTNVVTTRGNKCYFW